MTPVQLLHRQTEDEMMLTIRHHRKDFIRLPNFKG